MALFRVVSEIFNVEKYRDLEIRVRGNLRSFKVVFDRIGMLSCSIVTLSVIRNVFDIIDFKNAVTLKTGLRVRKVIENVTIR